MVNKPEPSGSIQPPGVDLFIQELLAKYPMQLFASLAQMGGTDISLPSKIAQNMLPKEPFEGSPKLARLVTLLPSLKNLSPELVKMLDASAKSENSPDHSPERSKEHPSQHSNQAAKGQQQQHAKGRLENQTAPEKRASDKSIPDKPGLAPQTKGESLQQKNGNLARTFHPGLSLGEKPPAAPSLPAMVSTIKEVLSILSYFANNISTLKPESLDAFQKLMQPLMDQLVQPVKKSQEGELESKNREIPGHKESEKSLPKEKSISHSFDIRQRSEKPLTEHRVDPKSKNADSLDQNNRGASPAASPRSKDSDFSKQNLHQPASNAKSGEAEAKPASLPVPTDRISIPAAPFSFQHPISTAPRRAKKKPEDPWEKEEEHSEEEEHPQEEEDPFLKK